MRFFIHVSELHFWSCVHRDKWFFGGDTHELQWWWSQEVVPVVLLCRLSRVLYYTDCPHSIFMESQLGNQWTYIKFQSYFIHQSCIYSYCIIIGTATRSFCLCIGIPLNYGDIEDVITRGEWEPISDIPGMIHIKICVDKVRVFTSLVDLSLALFEETLMMTLIHFQDVLLE